MSRSPRIRPSALTGAAGYAGAVAVLAHQLDQARVVVALLAGWVAIALVDALDQAADRVVARDVDAALAAPLDVKATAPRTAPRRPAEPGELRPCALCRVEPAVAGDELGWLCLGTVAGRPPADLKAAGAELSELAARYACHRRLRLTAPQLADVAACKAAGVAIDDAMLTVHGIDVRTPEQHRRRA